MRAYVLIDADEQDSRRIVTELRSKPGVLLADAVNGPHPVIACIEGADPSTVAQTILFDIRKIPGVADITVFLGLEDLDGTGPADELPDALRPVIEPKKSTKRNREGGSIVDG